MMQLMRAMPWLILVGICGDLLYFCFPFPPAVWRTLLLSCFIYTLLPMRGVRMTGFDKAVICFVVLNWIYYIAAYLISPLSYGLIFTISIALMAFVAMSRLGQKGLLTARYLVVSVIAIIVSAGFYYFHELAMILETYFQGQDLDVTVSGSSMFLFCLPFVFFIRKRYLAIAVVCVCTYFIVISAKRGNLVGAILPIMLYVYMTMRKTRNNVIAFAAISLALTGMAFWIVEYIQTNDYFIWRMQQTFEGKSSGRDIIYGQLWQYWSDSESVINMLLGYGWDGTLQGNTLHLYAHCDWLEALVDMGLVGLLVYVAIFWCAFGVYRRSKGDVAVRYCLLAIFSIWALKAMYSMGYLEEYLCIMAIPYGYCIQIIKNRKNHDENESPAIAGKSA